MGVTDWEPRALPSEARCKRWAELGGVFLACDEQGVVATMPAPAGPREYVFAVACGEGGIRVRPWLKGEPAGWDATFYPMTHPPIPEGWEKVGEWYACGVTGEKPQINDGVYTSGDGYAVPLRRTLPAIPAGWEPVGEWHDTLSPCSEVYDWTLLQDGRIVQRGETFRRQDEHIMGVHIRRVLPAVDWGDVPKGVALRPHGDTHIAVWKGGGLLGLIHQQPDCKWTARKVDGSGLYGNQPSDIAAIVALTGRRDE